MSTSLTFATRARLGLLVGVAVFAGTMGAAQAADSPIPHESVPVVAAGAFATGFFAVFGSHFVSVSW